MKKPLLWMSSWPISLISFVEIIEAKGPENGSLLQL